MGWKFVGPDGQERVLGAAGSTGPTGPTGPADGLSGALLNASLFAPVAETLISDCESTTGWVIANGGTLGTVTTFSTSPGGTKSVRAPGLATSWDNNPGLTSKAYLNLPSDQTVGTHEAIAIDFQWNFNAAINVSFDIAVVFEFFVSSAVDMGGITNTRRAPNLVSGDNMTVIIPVTGLSAVRSLGIRTRDVWNIQSGAKGDVLFDNIRWASQTELEAALGQAASQSVLLSADYAPSVAQRTFAIPSTQSILDTRPATTILSNFNGIKYARQYQLPEDRTTDVSAQIQEVIDSLVDGDSLLFPARKQYRVDSQQIVIRNLRNVTIDANDSAFFLTADRNPSLFALDTLSDITLRRFKGYGTRVETDLGSTFTNVTGSPTISGTTKQLDALDESIRPNRQSWYGRNPDGDIVLDFTLSQTANPSTTASDCSIELHSIDRPTTGPTCTLVGTEGPVPAGTRYYAVSYIDADGRETTLGPPTQFVGATAGLVDLSNIPIGPVVYDDDRIPIIGRRIYRTFAGAGNDQRAFRLIGELEDNTTTTFRDHAVESTSVPLVGATAATNLGAGNVEAGKHIWKMTYVFSDGHEGLGQTTGTNITPVSASQIGLTLATAGAGAGVVKRRLYRTKANAGNGDTDFLFLVEIPDNTTTSYTDNASDTSLVTTAIGPVQGSGKATHNYWQTFISPAQNTPTVYKLKARVNDELLASKYNIIVRKATSATNTITVTSHTSYSRVSYDPSLEANHLFTTSNGGGPTQSILIEHCHAEGLSGDFASWSGVRTRNIKIYRCSGRACRRQGFSAAQGGGYEISDSIFSETGRSGIDIETNTPDDEISGVKLSRVHLRNTTNWAITFNNWYSVDNATVDQCSYSGYEGIGFFLGGAKVFKMTDCHAPYKPSLFKGLDAEIDGLRTLSLTIKKETPSYTGAPTSSKMRVTNVRFSGSTSSPLTIDSGTDVQLGTLTDPVYGTIANGNALMRTAGTPSDATVFFGATGYDGVTAIDSTNHLLYYRDGGVWTAAGSTVPSSFALTGTITPTALTTNANDYNPTSLSTAAVIRQDSSANVNITGLQGGAQGRIIILVNVGSFTISLLDESSSSTTPANRFKLPAAYATLALAPQESATLQYNTTSSRWRLVATTSQPAPTGVGDHPASGISLDSTNVVGTADDVQEQLELIDPLIYDHSVRHEIGGADAIKLDDLAVPDDNTDLDASTTRHGLLKKLPGGTSNFLRADGAFATPPGGSSVAADPVFDAKGDAVFGTGADAAARLPIGTAGQYIAPDASATQGAAWVSPWNTAFLPTGALAENIPRLLVTSANNTAFATDTLVLVAIYLPRNLTITSISFHSGGTSALVAVNQWFALYDSSRNLLRQTNDDTNAAWASNSVKTLNLTSTYTTTTAGLFYVGINVKASQVQTLRGITATATQILALSPTLCGTSNAGNGATAPNPANAPTISGAIPYCYVS